MAKHARGRIARYAVSRRAGTPKQLHAFREAGHVLDATAPSADRLVFRRKIPI